MDRAKWLELCQLVGDNEVDIWYQKSEPLFHIDGIGSEEDLIRLTSYAYSWMPTIPKWKCKVDWSMVKEALHELDNGVPGALKLVFDRIVPVINNSIIGASKVLHFAYSDKVPIIDRNVVAGWRKLFFPDGIRVRNKNWDVAKLPSNFNGYGSNAVMRSNHIVRYISYAENMVLWKNTIGEVSIRDIETKLYLLGKLINKE